MSNSMFHVDHRYNPRCPWIVEISNVKTVARRSLHENLLILMDQFGQYDRQRNGQCQTVKSKEKLDHRMQQHVFLQMNINNGRPI